MTEQQGDKIIKLLEDIKKRTSDVWYILLFSYVMLLIIAMKV